MKWVHLWKFLRHAFPSCSVSSSPVCERPGFPGCPGGQRGGEEGWIIQLRSNSKHCIKGNVVGYNANSLSKVGHKTWKSLYAYDGVGGCNWSSWGRPVGPLSFPTTGRKQWGALCDPILKALLSLFLTSLIKPGTSAQNLGSWPYMQLFNMLPHFLG